MESMNKFKVLTIIVICMFIFAIAAIYSNTKDASEGKLQAKQQAQNEQVQDEIKTNENTDATNNSDTATQIDVLNRRIDELNDKIGNSDNNGTPLDCKIYGSMTSSGIEPLSPDAAVQEAKVNNNDLVITCSMK